MEEDMPEYILRNLDPQLWSRFTERGSRDGWPTKALFVALMTAYANGSISIGTLPPKQLPQYAWLRAHYRSAAKDDKFPTLDVNGRWSAIIREMIKGRAGGHWRELDQVPLDKRAEILNWLEATSTLPPQSALTLQAIGHISSITAAGETDRRVYDYRVLGLPPNQEARITNWDGGWRILYLAPGVTEEWNGPHETPQDALNTLARTIAGEETESPRYGAERSTF
ncbi:MAG TPA: hypothetical protein VFZ98_11580 [Vicinamibacterales bacterium]